MARAKFPLAWRIFVGTGIVVAAVLGGAILLTARAAERAAAGAATRAVSAMAAQVDGQLAGSARGLLDGVHVFAQAPGFRAVIGSGSRADALDQAREAADRLGATWVQITDANGIRLAKSDEPDAPPEPLGRTALIGGAVGGESVVAFGAAADTQVFQGAAVPIYGATPGKVAGVLMATRALDATAARRAVGESGGDAVLYTLPRDGGVRIAASTRPRTPALERSISALARDVVASGGASAARVSEMTIDGEHFFARSSPLRSADGRTLGGVIVLRSQAAELQPFREIERTMLFAGAAGLALALLVSFAIARQVTRPLGALVNATRQVAEGDYSARLQVRSRDEIGILASAFETMLADLREKQVLVEFARLKPTPPGGGVAVSPTAATSRIEREDDEGDYVAPNEAPEMLSGAMPRVMPEPVPNVGPANVVSAAAALRPGQRFAERYDIKYMLGAGGVGVVFLAADVLTGETVALKVLRPDVLRDDPVAAKRLARELDIACRLAHPNIVRVDALGESGGLHYITMEYVEGTALRRLIDTRGPLPVPVVMTLAKQLCRALGHAHDRGVVHRDVKPQNLVVTPNGLLKVMDFGTARLMTPSSGLTEPGVLFGTPAYMAPESLRGKGEDARVDVYAAGVVLYEALVGQLPFRTTGSPMAVLAQILETPPEDPAAVNPRVPRALADVVLRALAKSPDDRPQSASEFGVLLADAV